MATRSSKQKPDVRDQGSDGVPEVRLVLVFLALAFGFPVFGVFCFWVLPLGGTGIREQMSDARYQMII